MDPREERAREIQRQIAEVLLRSWDPIGIQDEPAARNQYDAYVGGVYRLLASGADARDIAEHLARVEATQMGLEDADPTMLFPVARRLLKINVKLDPSGPGA